MPIIQINMLPKKISHTFQTLKQLLEKTILDMNIDGILPGEVMVDIHTIPNDYVNDNNFVYVDMWMYGREDRTQELFDQVKQNVANTIIRHLSMYWNEFNMLEILPIHILNSNDCVVKVNNLIGGEEK